MCLHDKKRYAVGGGHIFILRCYKDVCAGERDGMGWDGIMPILHLVASGLRLPRSALSPKIRRGRGASERVRRERDSRPTPWWWPSLFGEFSVVFRRYVGFHPHQPQALTGSTSPPSTTTNPAAETRLLNHEHAANQVARSHRRGVRQALHQRLLRGRSKVRGGGAIPAPPAADFAAGMGTGGRRGGAGGASRRVGRPQSSGRRGRRGRMIA